MQKEWFVLHTLSGHEYKVRESISHRIAMEELDEVIGEVLIPTEKVSEVRKGKRTTVSRKFYPGYVLIECSLYDESRHLDERIWHFVNDTPGVIRFVGGDRPPPLSPEEVELIQGQIQEKKEKIKPKVEFEPGDTVKVTDGPFLNFNGVVEEVDPERGKLKISVSIFGRSAPVELEYWQVERGE